MSQASAAAAVDDEAGASGALADVSLKGTTRGMEILVSGSPSPAALATRLSELLAEAPGFFAGSEARVALDGVLPQGALACLEQVAARFDVRIVEVGPAAPRRRRAHVPAALRPEDAPHVSLAEGTGPIADEPVASGASAAPPGASSAAATSDAAAAAAADAALTDGVPAETGSGDAALAALDDTAPYSVVALIDHLSNSSATLAPAVTASASAATASASAASAARSPSTTQAHPVLFPHAASRPVASVPASLVAAAAPAAPAGPAGAAPPPPAAPPAPSAPNDPPSGASGPVAAAAEAAVPGARLVVGPVRSGVIVDHAGHVVIIGDVNPGAEVRAEGSIVVIGRLRGVAHAGIGRTAGFIIALSLQPQQLRIGRMVARAGDADRPSDGAEIAYATGETIVVERFNGRLPSGLAASM